MLKRENNSKNQEKNMKQTAKNTCAARRRCSAEWSL